ncbi:MAG TPA: class I SAM-dependent methyltransferase [Actinomycetes bacterium]
MTDRARREAITATYSGYGWPVDGTALLDRSLEPRSPEMLLEVAASLGLGAGQLVLDAGCREAGHAIAIARRFGCRVVGVDLVGTWLPMGRDDAAAAGLADRVAMVQGDLEALPLADAACDLVWCRDVLSCIGDCGRAMAECARVLRRGGGMVLYAVFATEELAAHERARLLGRPEHSAPSMDRATVEAAIAAAGFEVARRDRIGSEWFEYRLEHDPAAMTEDLLHVARLVRERDRFEPALGSDWYERALGFDQWSLYIVLGKLEPTVYALVRR